MKKEELVKEVKSIFHQLVESYDIGYKYAETSTEYYTDVYLYATDDFITSKMLNDVMRRTEVIREETSVNVGVSLYQGHPAIVAIINLKY